MLSALAPIDPRIRRLIAFFALGFFCVGAPRLFTNAAAFALFLDHFDADLLPYTYLLGGVTMPVLGVAYLQLSHRIGLGRLLMGALALNLVVLVALRYGLSGPDRSWVVFAATVWVEVEWTLGNLVFWGLAERVFDVREAKRHFGLLAAGDPAAAVAGGAVLPSLLLIMQVPDLLFVSAASIVLAMVLTFWICRHERMRLAAQDRQAGSEEQSGERRGGTRLYLGFVVALAFASHIVFFIVDNAFYALVEERFAERDTVAGFIGVFFAAMGVITLCINLFLTGRVLRLGGMRVALMAVPVTVLVCIAGVWAADRFGAGVALVFWAGCLTKLVHDGGWQGIGWPGFLLLYQPLPARERTRAQARLESFYEPVATGIAALALLAGTAWLGLDTVGLFVMAGLLVTAWLILCLPVTRLYHRMLARSVEERRLGDIDMELMDDQSLDVIRAGLESPRAEERLHCGRFLMSQTRPVAGAVVDGLLADEEPLVRTEVLRLLESSPRRELCEPLFERLAIERYPPARAALLRALTACGHPRAVEVLKKEMNSSSRRVRLGAMVGLLRHGGVDGVLAAGERFLALVRSGSATERWLAARVLAHADVRALDAHLDELLRDPDERVQREALRAAGSASSPALWSSLIPMLARPTLRREVMAVLAGAGPPAKPALLGAFEDLENEVIRRQLLCLLAPMDGARTLQLLLDHRETLSAETQHTVLMVLASCGYRSADAQRTLCHELLRRTSRRAFRTVEAIAALEHDANAALLVDALDASVSRDTDCAVALAGLVLDAPVARRPYSELLANEPERAAHLLELMDELLPAELARPITTLLESSGNHDRLTRLAPLHSSSGYSASDWLVRFAGESEETRSPWIQSCAWYALGLGQSELDTAAIAVALDSEHPVVRETALWAMHRVAHDYLEPVLTRMMEDESPMVARFAHSLASDRLARAGSR